MIYTYIIYDIYIYIHAYVVFTSVPNQHPRRLYFEPPGSTFPTAAQQSAMRAWRALRLKHQRVPKMQSPWEPKAVERQAPQPGAESGGRMFLSFRS